jgi:hypothetical protein
LATSVSLPGTIVIWTQMSGFAVLKVLTILARVSESGGVWLVQNLTTFALEAQLAPVTALGSALAPEAGALAPVLGGAALAPVGALEVVADGPQAVATSAIAGRRINHRNRPGIGLISPPCRSFRSSP